MISLTRTLTLTRARERARARACTHSLTHSPGGHLARPAPHQVWTDAYRPFTFDYDQDFLA